MEFLQCQLINVFSGGQATQNHFADHLMGFPKSYPLADQIVGHIGGIGKTTPGRTSQVFPVNLQRPEHWREHQQAFFHGIDRIKQGFLIFLHVFIIS